MFTYILICIERERETTSGPRLRRPPAAALGPDAGPEVLHREVADNSNNNINDNNNNDNSSSINIDIIVMIIMNDVIMIVIVKLIIAILILSMFIYIYMYMYNNDTINSSMINSNSNNDNNNGWSRRGARGPAPIGSTASEIVREFTKGGLVKGGLAIYVFPLCNCNTLGSAFNVEVERMPHC